MVRPIYSDGKNDGTVPVLCVFAGKSGDVKPTENVMTGSVFIEVNTGDSYFFEEESSTWYKDGESDEE